MSAHGSFGGTHAQNLHISPPQESPSRSARPAEDGTGTDSQLDAGPADIKGDWPDD